MKELVTVRVNHLAYFTEEKKAQAQSEIVLVLSEPGYSMGPEDQLMRERELTHCRFAATPEAMRKLAGIFNGLAEESEKFLKEVVTAAAADEAKQG